MTVILGIVTTLAVTLLSVLAIAILTWLIACRCMILIFSCGRILRRIIHLLIAVFIFPEIG